MTSVDDQPPTALTEADLREWRRHPGDVAHLVFALAVLAFLLAVTALTPTALRDASADLILLLARLPETLRDAMLGLAQTATLLIPLAVLAWLLLRRPLAAAGLVVGAAVVAGIGMAMLTDWLQRAAPPEAIDDLPSTWLVGSDFPSASFLAALVAGATAASPLMVRPWRVTAWSGVGVAVLVRLLSATQAPVNVAVTLALGAVIGSAVLVIIGSPQRRPGASTLRGLLDDAGLAVDELRPEEVSTGRRTYLGVADGRPLRVAYLDRDDRDADLLARAIRNVRVHSIDDDNLALGARRRVEHEALVTLLAAQAGASVPTVLAVTPSGDESAVIATTAPPGSAAGGPHGMSDGALDDAWRQLGALHGARIAHRSLIADNLLVDGDHVTLCGLANARLAASAEQRAADMAELLVTTAAAAGVERAAAAALRSTDHGELERALRFVQLPALPAGTRRALKGRRDLPDEIRTAVQEGLGVDKVELAELRRISLMQVVTWIGFAILAFFVLTLITSWSEISDAMRGIDWVWVVPAVIATLLGTIAGAMSLAGSVPRVVPLTEATIVMFGQSFLNRFTPANAGGMAMRIRYLQKGGSNLATATTAIGLTSAASGVMQVVFIAFFFLWSGTGGGTEGVDTGGGGLDATIVVVFVVAVGAAALVLAFSRRLRQWLAGFVRATVTKVREDLGELVRQPSKLALLFGGAGLAKLTTIVAFVASCRAFGIDLSFAELGARYLGANTVASAVPTPGGVGAIEAALVFVLTNGGVEDATAWAAVLLFRLVNYWLPTVPGYIGLKISERRQLV